MRKPSWLSKAPYTPGRDSELYNIEDGSIDEETDFLSSHRCSMVKRYHMPTFFTPDKKNLSSSLGTNNNSPAVNMTDSINVNQPNNLFSGNETIMEETNENDESHLLNTRFSQKFNDDNNDNDRDYAIM